MDLSEDEKRLAAWCLRTIGDQFIAGKHGDRRPPTQVAQNGYLECYRLADKIVGGRVRTKVKIEEISDEGGLGGDF